MTTPQDSQATLPFRLQDDLDFSCGQVVNSSNPSSQDTETHDDQLDDREWAGIEIPDSPFYDSSPVPPIVLEQDSDPTQDNIPSQDDVSVHKVVADQQDDSDHDTVLSQGASPTQRAKRKRNSGMLSLLSVKYPVTSMTSYLETQYQRSMTRVMSLDDKIARLRAGSPSYRRAMTERKMLKDQADSALDILYPAQRLTPELRLLADTVRMVENTINKRTKRSK